MKFKQVATDIKKFLTKPKTFVAGLVVGAIVAIIVWSHFFAAPKEGEHVVETLSPSVVFGRVVEQDELVSASQNYCIVDKATDTAKLFDFIELPWTQNSFWYRYCGTIKAGINLKTAGFAQDENDPAKITITLDQPYLISNTPEFGPDKSGVLEENNNVFNPIEIKDVDAFQRQCIERSEKDAVEGGIYDDARENAEENLRGIFNAAFGDQYELTFIYRDAS